MSAKSFAQKCEETLQVFTKPWALALLILGFSAGLPYMLIFSTMSLWLQEAGIDKSTITMFSWAALGSSFKFLWAPLVDTLPLPLLTARLGRRRGWLLFAQLGVMAAIVWIAAVQPQAGSVELMALAATALGFAAATQDIVIDAYRIELAPDDAAKQSVMAAGYTAGYRIGMIVSGAGALFIAEFLGSTKTHYSYTAWSRTYLIMAGLMLGCMAATLCLREPAANTAVRANRNELKENVRLFAAFLLCTAVFAAAFRLIHFKTDGVFFAFLASAARLLAAVLAAAAAAWLLMRLRFVPQAAVQRLWVQPLTDFFRRYGKAALILLALIGFYRVSDMVAGTVQNLFYADLGFSKDEIAKATKAFAVVMTIIGGFLGGTLAQRVPLMKLMMLGAFSASSTNLLFSALAHIGHNMPFLYLTVMLDFLASGMAGTIFIAFLSSLTNIRFTAVQYALFSSLMTLFPKLLGGYSGTIAAQIGYSNFFLATALAGVPILALIWLASRYLPLQAAAD